MKVIYGTLCNCVPYEKKLVEDLSSSSKELRRVKCPVCGATAILMLEDYA